MHAMPTLTLSFTCHQLQCLHTPCVFSEPQVIASVMSTSRSTSYTVRFFDDGSKEDSVPREEITFSSVESGEGSSEGAQLSVGCFVVVRGRNAVVVPASPSGPSPTVPGVATGSGTTKRPKRIAETG